jgi:hypothetical protein
MRSAILRLNSSPRILIWRPRTMLPRFLDLPVAATLDDDDGIVCEADQHAGSACREQPAAGTFCLLRTSAGGTAGAGRARMAVTRRPSGEHACMCSILHDADHSSALLANGAVYNEIPTGGRAIRNQPLRHHQTWLTWTIEKRRQLWSTSSARCVTRRFRSRGQRR